MPTQSLSLYQNSMKRNKFISPFVDIFLFSLAIGVACVATGCCDRKYDVVIVGASNIVGKPLASMMLQKGATISVCHIHTKDLASYTKNADIVCVGVGKPNLINKEMLKQGAILVDIGINRLESGELTGDASKDVEQVCSYLTPVPGGVGPMTISSLLKNTIIAANMFDKDDLGLFNGTICVPQIVAAALGGQVLHLFTRPGAVPPEVNMLVLAGCLLIIGAMCVSIIKEKK